MKTFILTIGGFDNLGKFLYESTRFVDVIDTIMEYFNFWSYIPIDAELNPIEGSWLIKAQVTFPPSTCEEMERFARENGAEIFKLLPLS